MEETKLPKPAEKDDRIPGPWSISGLKTCDDCAHKAWLMRKHKLPDFYELPRAVGSKAHEALEQYGRICVFKLGQEQNDVAAEMCIRNMRAAMTSDEWEDISDSIINFVSKLRFPVDKISAAAIEHKLAVDCRWQPCEYDSPDAYFRIRNDVAFFEDDETIVIWDYKTGRLVETFTDPKAQLQLHAYALVFKAYHPKLKKFKVMNRYTRFGFDVEVPDISEEDLEYTREIINDKISYYSTLEKFEANLQSACVNCGAKHACYKWQEWRDKIAQLSGRVPWELETDEVRGDDTESVTKRLAMFAFVGAQEVVTARDLLRLHFERNGSMPIQMGSQDVVFGNFPKDSWSVTKPAQLLARLRELGFEEADLWKHFGVTASEIEKLLKKAKRKDLLAELQRDFMKQTKKNDWKFMTIGKEDATDEAEG